MSTSCQRNSARLTPKVDFFFTSISTFLLSVNSTTKEGFAIPSLSRCCRYAPSHRSASVFTYLPSLTPAPALPRPRTHPTVGSAPAMVTARPASVSATRVGTAWTARDKGPPSRSERRVGGGREEGEGGTYLNHERTKHRDKEYPGWETF